MCLKNDEEVVLKISYGVVVNENGLHGGPYTNTLATINIDIDPLPIVKNWVNTNYPFFSLSDKVDISGLVSYWLEKNGKIIISSDYNPRYPDMVHTIYTAEAD